MEELKVFYILVPLMVRFPCFLNVAPYFPFALGSANYAPGPACRYSLDPSPLELNLEQW